MHGERRRETHFNVCVCVCARPLVSRIKFMFICICKVDNLHVNCYLARTHRQEREQRHTGASTAITSDECETFASVMVDKMQK